MVAFCLKYIESVRVDFPSIYILYSTVTLYFSNLKKNVPKNLVFLVWNVNRIYHRILPTSAEGPLKYYVHDPNDRLSSDFLTESERSTLASWVQIIDEILQCNNQLVQHLTTMRERPTREVFLDISWRNESNEVGLVMSSNDEMHVPSRHAVAFLRDGAEKFISINSPFWEPLQFPLLFPRGEMGFFRFGESARVMSIKNKRITAMWWYRQMVLRHPHVPLLGRLVNEYLLDGFSRIEEERLGWIRYNQKKFNIASRNQILDETIAAELPQIGKVYLPASFPGSIRYQRVLTADGLAIVARMGKPTFFITMTCNPHWSEILEELKPGQTASDRPDVTVRVFHAKQTVLLRVLRSGEVFGSRAAYLFCVTEFQKRGLPHCHIALRIHGHQPLTPAEIDGCICAERFDPDQPHNQEIEKLVQSHMIHRCQSLCRQSSMDSADRCSRHFPFPITSTTYIDDRGYCAYKRRTSEDRYVVPYNPKLLLMFQCHVNVELAHTVNIIAYLYKYLYKGPDRAKLRVLDETDNSVDEISDYINARYVSSSEAAWRIFGYNINVREPSVTSYSVHLLGEDKIFFDASQTASSILSQRALNHVSDLMRYFGRPFNASPENTTADFVDFDELTFSSYFEKFQLSSKQPKSNTHYWRDCPVVEDENGTKLPIAVSLLQKLPKCHIKT